MSDDLQLVTGGSGYFGSLLVERLRCDGAPVRVFDLVDTDYRPGQIEFVRGDIRDRESVERACAGAAVIYHCVAQVPLARDRALFQQVNVQGTSNLLAAAVRCGARKVVLLSSSAVYGIPERNPIDDSSVPLPLEAYGQAKLEAERVARAYHDEQGLDVTIIRPRTILGHGRLGIFELLFDWIWAGKDVYVFGSGENLYQFVHADDLAGACIKAGQRPGLAIYNVGAEKFCTMRQSLEGLAAHAGTGSRVRSIPMAPAAFLMEALSRANLLPFAPYHWLMYGREIYFDLTRTKEELKWAPRWGNIEMLCQSYDWYVTHRGELKGAGVKSPHRSAVSQGLLKVLKWIS